VLCRQIFKLSVGFLFRGLIKNEVLKEFEVLLTKAFIGQVSIFSQDVSSKIVVLVLAVQEDEIWECFAGERGIIQKEI